MRNFSPQQMFFYAFHSFLKTQWSSKGWKRSNVLLSFIQGGGTDLSRASVPRPQKRQISRISGYQNWGSWSQVRTAPQLLSALFQHLALRFLQLRHKIKHTHTHTQTHTVLFLIKENFRQRTKSCPYLHQKGLAVPFKGAWISPGEPSVVCLIL